MPVMAGIESQVQSAVEAGQTVRYTVTPIYVGNHPVPRGITIEAQGSGGFSLGVSVLNPPGVP
jgi:DNA/RNA non-specific endonuclease